MHRRRATLALVAIIAVLGAMIATELPASADNPETTGQFEGLFSRGHLFDSAPPANPTQSAIEPTAVSDVALPNGQFVYWNGLENLENATTPLAANGGVTASYHHPSRSRLMTNPGSAATWQVPTPEGTGGGDVFCADQRILLDGTVLAAGGTVWKNDPVDVSAYTPPAAPGGTTELFGNRAARVFNPSGASWSQVGVRNPASDTIEGTPDVDPPYSTGSYTGYMHYGRWYPALLTLPNGKLFVAGGVGRLIYNSTGFNVSHTETFDPYTSNGYDPVHGKWIDNGESGASTFPLFPRLHVIADGKIFYSANGQMWGPFGQAADEALWNFMKFYDPATNNWTDVGAPQGPDPVTAVGRTGIWGATSGAAEIMLPFTPDKNGNYKTTQILQAGGVLGTSPGAFVAMNLARKITIDSHDNVSTEQVASTNNNRWYSSGVIGATGEPMIFSGADKDEVICGGCEQAVKQAEMYDVAADKWIPLASATRDRTYHNSAILLADGRILTGGHSPINFLYGPGGTGPTGNNSAHDSGAPFANNYKDPSFQIFDPPYLFRGPRPSITREVTGWLGWDSDLNITTPDAGTVDDAILVHMPATTHTTDADMRAIVLPITSRMQGSVKVHIPAERGVAIPGWYYVFLRQTNPGFTKPTVSVGKIVRVGNPSDLGFAAPVSKLAAARVASAKSIAAIATIPGVKASASVIAPKIAPVSSHSAPSRSSSAGLLAALAALMVFAARTAIRRRRVRA